MGKDVELLHLEPEWAKFLFGDVFRYKQGQTSSPNLGWKKWTFSNE